MGFKIGEKVLVDGVIVDVINRENVRISFSGANVLVGVRDVRAWCAAPPPPVTEFWKDPGEPCRIMSDGSVQEGGGTDPLGEHGIKWVPAEDPQKVLCRYIRSLVKR